MFVGLNIPLANNFVAYTEADAEYVGVILQNLAWMQETLMLLVECFTRGIMLVIQANPG